MSLLLQRLMLRALQTCSCVLFQYLFEHHKGGWNCSGMEDAATAC
jgi:hypothetical protein